MTRVMDYVQEALANVPASAIQAGFEQAVHELRQRIAALPGLAPHEKSEHPESATPSRKGPMLC